jgi:hypothetical protein
MARAFPKSYRNLKFGSRKSITTNPKYNINTMVLLTSNETHGSYTIKHNKNIIYDIVNFSILLGSLLPKTNGMAWRRRQGHRRRWES